MSPRFVLHGREENEPGIKLVRIPIAEPITPSSIAASTAFSSHVASSFSRSTFRSISERIMVEQYVVDTVTCLGYTGVRRSWQFPGPTPGKEVTFEERPVRVFSRFFRCVTHCSPGCYSN